MYTTKSLILIVILFISLEAITVSPLCPTNKIAPRRRDAVWEYNRGRTFGAFYDLLAPGSPQNNVALNDLQEKPQEDEPGDDCGEIEDYDENDLSSVTLQSYRRYGTNNNYNGFLGGIFSRPPYRPGNRPPPPDKPHRPHPPSRPPFWSGGTFGNNHYRPPTSQYPSDYVKPVHENNQQQSEPYRPDIVGGILGHVVGVSPVRPTIRPDNQDLRRRTPKYYSSYTTFPPTTVKEYDNPSRERQRPRSVNTNSIFGSFIDLLFK